VWASQRLLRSSRKPFFASAEFANFNQRSSPLEVVERRNAATLLLTAGGNNSLSERTRTWSNLLKPAGSIWSPRGLSLKPATSNETPRAQAKPRACAVCHFRLFVFKAFVWHDLLAWWEWPPLLAPWPYGVSSVIPSLERDAARLPFIRLPVALHARRFLACICAGHFWKRLYFTSP